MYKEGNQTKTQRSSRQHSSLQKDKKTVEGFVVFFALTLGFQVRLVELNFRLVLLLVFLLAWLGFSSASIGVFVWVCFIVKFWFASLVLLAFWDRFSFHCMAWMCCSTSICFCFFLV